MSRKEIIVAVLEGLVRSWRTTREALAAELEAIAAELRKGKLVPDEAFARSRTDAAAVRGVRDRLPDE